MKKSILFAVVMSFSVVPSAFALDISAVGSFEISSLTTNMNTSNDSATSNGETVTNEGFSQDNSVSGGLLLAQNLGEILSIETGLLYIPRYFYQNAQFSGVADGNVVVTYTYKYLEVPLLLRVHFLKGLSLGVGGYYAHAMGNIGILANTANATIAQALGSQPTSDGYEDYGVSRTDYGFLFALGAKIPLSPVFSIDVDARYALGMANINNGQVTTVNTTANPSDVNKWRDIQFLLGLTASL